MWEHVLQLNIIHLLRSIYKYVFPPVILFTASDCGRNMCLIIVFRSRAARRPQKVSMHLHYPVLCLNNIRRWLRPKCTKVPGNSNSSCMSAECERKMGTIRMPVAKIPQDVRDLAIEDNTIMMPVDKDILPPYEEGGVFAGQ